MAFKDYEWVASVVQAHEGHRVLGRTRLQKTIKLLQRLGMPTDYGYNIHFYGPYSEELQADLTLLESTRLVEEHGESTRDGNTMYVISSVIQHGTDAVNLPSVSRFKKSIEMMEKADPVLLELAATYDAFREMGIEHAEAWERLHEKKGPKCDQGRDVKALELLKSLGLLAKGLTA